MSTEPLTGFMMKPADILVFSLVSSLVSPPYMDVNFMSSFLPECICFMSSALSPLSLILSISFGLNCTGHSRPHSCASCRLRGGCLHTLATRVTGTNALMSSGIAVRSFTGHITTSSGVDGFLVSEPSSDTPSVPVGVFVGVLLRALFKCPSYNII